jgi:hypothetical protein
VDEEINQDYLFISFVSEGLTISLPEQVRLSLYPYGYKYLPENAY